VRIATRVTFVVSTALDVLEQVEVSDESRDRRSSLAY
jgi:hypothetical protein